MTKKLQDVISIIQLKAVNLNLYFYLCRHTIFWNLQQKTRKYEGNKSTQLHKTTN